jgi:tetrahydromethanopterin S-methyltransferase subunit A
VPGDYLVGNREGSTAICTLANADLPGRLMSLDEPALALVGRCRTENIGIEKLVQNVTATPSIRWLILCGEEARGHSPGEALLRLSQNGVDAAMRIQGATSWRPVLKNLTLKEVSRFRRQVTILDCIGTTDPAAIGEKLRACAARPAEPLEAFLGGPPPPGIPRIAARAPSRLQLDPAGFFIILVDRGRHLLVCEHYSNDGRLDRIIEGRHAVLVAATAVEQDLVWRLDHAAYLGRELSRAEAALESGASYRQDAALGEPDRRQTGETTEPGTF